MRGPWTGGPAFASARDTLTRFSEAVLAAEVRAETQQSGALRYRVPRSARPAGSSRAWRGPYLIVDPEPGEHLQPALIAVMPSHDTGRGVAPHRRRS